MPSLLVLEDGTGVANSNAYATAQEMIDYFAAVNVDVTGWGTPRLEARIIATCRYMTARFRFRWQGRRVSWIQAMDWPRYGVLLSLGEDVDYWYPGFGPGIGTAASIFPSNQVPAEVKQATCEYAYRLDLNFTAGQNTGPDVLMPDLLPGDDGILREQVGPIDVQYQAGRNPVPVWAFVDAALKPYLRYGSNQLNIVRG